MDAHAAEDVDSTDIESFEDVDIDHYYDQYYQDDYQVEPINVVTACFIPVIQDALIELILPTFLSTLILQLISSTSTFKTLLISSRGKILIIITGIVTLLYHFRLNPHLFLFILIAYISTSFIFINASIKYPRLSSPWYLCGFTIFLNEVFALNKGEYRIRMYMMLLLMRMVSYEDHHSGEVSKVLSKKELKKQGPSHLNLLDILTYLFHPSTLLLNVWHPYTRPKLISLESHSIISLLKILGWLLLSLIFLLLSMCLITVLKEDYVDRVVANFLYYNVQSDVAMGLFTLISAYLIALEFRCSHYFICYLTKASLQLVKVQDDVCHASYVEMPRSLVQVVVAWNIPMHTWLKRHVFTELKRKYNILVTIFVTYVISSSMHGFNFQIWSVLLSLGLLTFIEERLRFKLGNKLNACVESRPCHENNCHHANRRGLTVFITNAFFSFLAVVHLAYLGASFDGQEEASYAANVIRVWSDLSFYSHTIAIVTFVIYLLI